MTGKGNAYSLLAMTQKPLEAIRRKTWNRGKVIGLMVVAFTLVVLGHKKFGGKLFQDLGTTRSQVDNPSLIQPLTLDATNQLKPQDWLTYSFKTDGTGKSAVPVKPGVRIFMDSTSIEIGPMSASLTETTVSDSMLDTSAKFAANLGLDAGMAKLGAFAGAVKASADATATARFETKFFRADFYVYAKKKTAQMTYIHPEKHLRPDVKDALLSDEPAQIFAKFGAFYATHMELGAVSHTTITKKKLKGQTLAEFNTLVSANSDKLLQLGSVDAGVSVSVGNTLSTNQLHAVSKTEGGDPLVWLQLTKDNRQEILQKWADTVADDNMVAVNYRLDPLWNLLKPLNQAKGEALEKYMKTLWHDQQSKLLEIEKVPDAVPRLSRVYGAKQGLWVWDDSGYGVLSGGNKVRVEQPQPVQKDGTTYYAAGDAFNFEDHSKNYLGDLPMYAGDIVHPEHWDLEWKDTGVKCSGSHCAKMWWPKTKHGYKCIASAITRFYLIKNDNKKPDSSKYACFPEECIWEKKATKEKWQHKVWWKGRQVTFFEVHESPKYIHVTARQHDGVVVHGLKKACFE